MAKAPRLKVFRTPTGFHDAYVAAPSRKAALAAWGSSHDLFARGVAEEVTDPALTAEPLARPGEVIKRLRGSAAEQLAALPDTPAPAPRRVRDDVVDDEAPVRRRGTRKALARERAEAAPNTPPPPPKPKRPRPDRRALEAAEAALAEAEARWSAARRDLDWQEAELARARRAQREAEATERDELEAARDAAEIAYGEALAAWRAQ